MKNKQFLFNALFGLFLMLVLKSQCYGFQDVQVFSGTAKLADDSRRVFLEFDQNDESLIRWGIENSGRYRIPLSNVKISEYSNFKTFSGDMTFFGAGSFGSIEGVLKGDELKGEMVWHRDTVSLSLTATTRILSYEEETLAFGDKNLQLRGTLVKPKVGTGTYPVVIFSHGSGSSWRWWGMYWAAELAKIGIASFLYDKRGCGESGGSWQKASLDDLALDVAAAIKALKSHAAIDVKKIGVYGVSQGAWVAGRAYEFSNDISFLVANSGGGISPRDEELFSYDTNMKFAGIGTLDRKMGLQLIENYFEYLQEDIDLPELKIRMQRVKKEKWYPILGLERILISPEDRKNWQWVATYDPIKDISKIDSPVLLLFGEEDHVQPSTVAIEKWEEGLKIAGNKHYQVELFKQAGHGLVVGGHHVKGFPKYAKSFIPLLQAWLIEKVLKN